MKKINKIILAMIICISSILFSACGFFDDRYDVNDEEGIEYEEKVMANIGGYKVAYRPNSYPYRYYYENLAETLLTKLYSTFGVGGVLLDNNDENNNPRNILEEKLKNKDINDKYEYAYYLDDVRYSVYASTNSEGQNINLDGSVLDGETNGPVYYAYQDEDDKWKWWAPDIKVENDNGNDVTKFPEPIFVRNFGCVKNLENILSYYGDDTYFPLIKDYYKNLVKIYTPALQTAILQIVLGETPSEFDLSDIDNKIVSKLLGTASLVNGQVTGTGLKLRLQKEGTYVGLYDTDKTKIEDYILKNVIGLNKTHEYNPDNHFTEQDYRNVIREVWEFDLQIIDEIENPKNTYGNLFEPYPAICVKNYLKNTFFISSEEGKAFSNIPAMQYNSMVVLPKDDVYLYEIWLVFASKDNLKINTYYRYYDKNANTLKIGKVKKVIAGPESIFDAYEDDYYTFNFKDSSGEETLCYLDKFNNNIGGGALNGSNENTLMDREMSKYYDLIESNNGFGSITVLNADMFNTNDGCSYLEFVFDVEKTNNEKDKDYSFKVGLAGIWQGDDEMIQDYGIAN